MKPLRKGSRGDPVVELQEALIRAGYRIGVDGKFGDGTELAVRNFQRAHGLLRDGVVGPKTLGLLRMRGAPKPLPKPVAPRPGSPPPGAMLRAGTRGATDGEMRGWIAGVFSMHARFGFLAGLGAERTVQVPLAPNDVSKNPVHLSLSRRGMDFIYAIETGALPSDNDGTGSKETKQLHWPKGESGVTLGPGYDMRDRTPETIQSHMEEIGMDKATAKILSGGASLTGSAAKKFVADKRSSVKDLSLAQELALLRLIAPHYERFVKKWVKIDLLQSEYDALVCFTYNPGASIVPVTRAINEGEVAKAMSIIRSRVPPKGADNYAGLVKRREREVALYTTGQYALR